MHFGCIPIYISGFHHKQCVSDGKDLTFLSFPSQMFISDDESLKDETRLLLLQESTLVALYIFLFTQIIYVVKPVHIFMVKGRASKSYLVAQVHFGCVPIYKYIYI